MATIYVTQNGTGDGSSPASARSIAWLNTAGNWNQGAGTVCASATTATVRDTVIFSGTITTAFDWPYATYVGAAGIRFLFDAGAKFSAPEWGSSPHFAAFYWESAAYQKFDVEIDFGVDGYIECTNNGTLLTHKSGCIGIYARSPSRLTIINPRIYNIYVRVVGLEQVENATGIFIESYGPAVKDITVLGGTIHDTANAIAITGGAGSQNILVQGVHIYNVNWGVSAAISASGATLSNVVVRGCNIHDMECWDVPLGEVGYEAFHHNCVFFYGEPTAVNFIDGLIEGNIFGPNLGVRATSAVYLSHWTMKGTYTVRNNTFKGDPTNGLLTVGTAEGSTTYVHNNTFMVTSPGNSALVAGGSYAGAGMTVVSRNNVVSNGAYLQVNYSANVTIDSDYNAVYGYTAGFPGPVSRGLTSSVGAVPWATWQGEGKDTHSIIDQNPLLDVNGRPGTGSPVLGIGLNLSSSFNTDFDGVTRVPPWDMGAFKGAGVADTTPPTPNPSTLSSVTVNSSTQITAVANTATDAVSSPVEYNFAIGGAYQGWQSSATKVFSGLTPSTLYLIKVKARDAALNETTESSESSATTNAGVLVTLASPVGTHRLSNVFAMGGY